MLIADKKFEKVNELSNRDEYEGCSFLNCNLADGNFSTTKFVECEFVECNLSNVLVSDTSFREVSFRNCKMIGIQFDTCNRLLFEASFEGCQLDHSVFFQMKLKQAHFKNCQLVETDFSEADLSNSKLIGCDMSGAKFDHTTLEKADLTGSYNLVIDPEINNVQKANIPFSQLPGLLSKYNLKIVKDF